MEFWLSGKSADTAGETSPPPVATPPAPPTPENHAEIESEEDTYRNIDEVSNYPSSAASINILE